GNYRGQNASAVAAYYHPNEDTLINVGSTLGSGNNMVTAGVSFKFGPGGDTHTMSRTALTQKLSAVTQENQSLRKDVAGLREDNQELRDAVLALQKQVAELASHNK
ncbi:YadA-like family protein, partial [Mitsuokella jalaludinii]|uniref:YadA-like family protein n=1 Tax=Mitsuokella jalaludinii TaxID=187979 RepID=UPI003F89ECD3